MKKDTAIIISIGIVLILVVLYMSFSELPSEKSPQEIHLEQERKEYLKNPTNISEKKEYVNTLLEHTNYSEAESLLLEKRTQQVDSAWSNRKLGRLYEEQGEIEKAEEHYLKAIEVDENYSIGYSNYAHFLESQGRSDEAKEMLERVSKTNESSEIMASLGFLHIRNGELEKAREIFERMLVIDPVDDNAHLGLGNVLQKLEEFDEAEKVLQRAVDRNTQYGFIYLEYGSLLLDKGENATADAMFNRAIEIDIYLSDEVEYRKNIVHNNTNIQRIII